jgi:CheY-like chemotaxis protein
MDDDLLVFADEKAPPAGPVLKPWKLLIVDDEASIHDMTKRVLADIRFENRPLAFLDAYDGTEACAVMAAHDDIAIILLDVVMETDDAGLRVVRYIRDELNNHFTRIILRTGQPGQVPETKVITAYDINDYKEKTELTATKMFTIIVSSLRDYQLLHVIDRSRKGLERILSAARDLGRMQAFGEFAEGLITQVIGLLKMDEDSLLLSIDGFTAEAIGDRFTLLAGTGEFAGSDYRNGAKPLPQEVSVLLERALRERASIFEGDTYIGYMASAESSEVRLLYLNGCRDLTETDRRLIRIFVENMSVSADNISRNLSLCQGHQSLLGLIEHLLLRDEHIPHLGRLAAALAAKAGMDPAGQDRIARGARFAGMSGGLGMAECARLAKQQDSVSPLIQTALDIAAGTQTPPPPGDYPAARVVNVAKAIEEALDSGTHPAAVLASDAHLDPVLRQLALAALPELLRAADEGGTTA